MLYLDLFPSDPIDDADHEVVSQFWFQLKISMFQLALIKILGDISL